MDISNPAFEDDYEDEYGKRVDTSIENTSFFYKNSAFQLKDYVRFVKDGNVSNEDFKNIYEKLTTAQKDYVANHILPPVTTQQQQAAQMLQPQPSTSSKPQEEIEIEDISGHIARIPLNEDNLQDDTSFSRPPNVYLHKEEFKITEMEDKIEKMLKDIIRLRE